MKQVMIVITLLFSLWQQGICQCDAFENLLKEGQNHLATSPPSYEEAINSYTAALVACPERAEEALLEIELMTTEVDRLRRYAEIQRQEAALALLAADSAKAGVQTAVEKANNIISSFYFYSDRFALASDRDGARNRYYFIDRDGHAIDKLGYWDRAEPFSERGFAKVWVGIGSPQTYLLDTFGRTYRAAFSVQELEKDGGFRAVDFTGLGLKELPETLWDNENLEVLLLRDNALESLPAEFTRLKKLEILDLHKNKLDSLPQQLGTLEGLRWLDLGTNTGLRKIPESIGQLQHLQWLDLTSTSLDTIPEEFCRLSELRSLFIGSRILPSIPENIGILNQLTELRISGDRIERMPESFSDLVNLETLEITCRKLSALPTGLGNFRGLRSLYIRSGSLEELPESFAKLEKLRTLTLNIPKCKNISERFGDFLELRSLLLACDSLEYLPASICKMTELENLELAGKNITSMPDQIGNLRNLQRLYIRSSKKLETLPPGIGDLKNLTELAITSTSVQTLPATIGQLQRLRKLRLRDNSLESIPAEITQLDSIVDLELQSNELAELPQGFERLIDRCKVRISNNPFVMLSDEVIDPKVFSMEEILRILQSCLNSKNLELAITIRKNVEKFELRGADYVKLAYLLLPINDYEGAIWAGTQYEPENAKGVAVITSILAQAHLYSGNFEKALERYRSNASTPNTYLREIEHAERNGYAIADQAVVDQAKQWLQDEINSLREKETKGSKSRGR